MNRHIATYLSLFTGFVLVFLPAARAKNVDLDAYANTLSSVVDGRGMVNYRGLKEERTELDRYVQSIGRLDRRTYLGWTDERKIAFWINAYNAITLQTIIDHYPIEPRFPYNLRYPDNSIRQIPGVWKKLKHTVMGQSMTLDEIEHETLRQHFDEPRIHMALVCAAMSCPPLRAEPYRGDRLKEQFADQARRFLADPGNFYIARNENAVYLSSIFKWFGEDFISRFGGRLSVSGASSETEAVLTYVEAFLAQDEQAFIRKGGYNVEWLDYDWSLNEQE